jgi:hypothetical protein
MNVLDLMPLPLAAKGAYALRQRYERRARRHDQPLQNPSNGEHAQGQNRPLGRLRGRLHSTR